MKPLNKENLLSIAKQNYNQGTRTLRKHKDLEVTRMVELKNWQWENYTANLQESLTYGNRHLLDPEKTGNPPNRSNARWNAM